MGIRFTSSVLPETLGSHAIINAGRADCNGLSGDGVQRVPSGTTHTFVHAIPSPCHRLHNIDRLLCTATAMP